MTDPFFALGDPIRRDVLERLFADNGQSVRELNEGVSISRQAMAKHLDVLESAKLVVAKRVGREKLHFISTTVLSATVGRWILRFREADGKQGEPARRVESAPASKERVKRRVRNDRRPDHLSKPDRAKKNARKRHKEEFLKRQREAFEEFKASNFLHSRW